MDVVLCIRIYLLPLLDKDVRLIVDFRFDFRCSFIDATTLHDRYICLEIGTQINQMCFYEKSIQRLVCEFPQNAEYDTDKTLLGGVTLN